MLYIALTHFMPMIYFYTPWKHQKTIGFLMFSGGIERQVTWTEFTWEIELLYFKTSVEMYGKIPTGIIGFIQQTCWWWSLLTSVVLVFPFFQCFPIFGSSCSERPVIIEAEGTKWVQRRLQNPFKHRWSFLRKEVAVESCGKEYHHWKG